MKGAFQIARIFGIPVQIHWTFPLIFVYLLYMGYSRSWDWNDLAWATLIVLTLFTCVVFHEFGHALAARRYGVQTRDIILSPIGGVARLDRLPEKPLQEFFVAFAGPMVNIVIALMVFPYLFSNPETWRQLRYLVQPESNYFLGNLALLDYFLMGLFLLNVTLATFNLLPAFPMDGGRILRALLSIPFGRIRATYLASLVGQLMAIGIMYYGFFEMESLFTTFIGVFVFVTAGSERRSVRLEDLLNQYRVGEVMRRLFTRIYLQDTIEQPVEVLSQGLERHFLVFDDWQNLVGTLSEERLLQAVRKKDFGSPVTAYLSPGYEALVPEDTLGEAVRLLQSKPGGLLPVFQQGNLIGLIDLQLIHHFLQMQEKTRNGEGGPWWKRLFRRRNLV